MVTDIRSSTQIKTSRAPAAVGKPFAAAQRRADGEQVRFIPATLSPALQAA